jgi:FeS assembly SUF system protein
MNDQNNSGADEATAASGSASHEEPFSAPTAPATSTPSTGTSAAVPESSVASGDQVAPGDPSAPSGQTSGASDAATPEAGGAAALDPWKLREQIIQVLHTVYDPEIPVDIWELGLVYRLDVRENGDVSIQMTLTSPLCPVAGSLPPEVRQKVQSVPGVHDVQVELTWDPPWHMGMMTDVARLKLGFM